MRVIRRTFWQAPKAALNDARSNPVTNAASRRANRSEQVDHPDPRILGLPLPCAKGALAASPNLSVRGNDDANPSHV